MGQYLLERNVFGEIALYGGSAILFQFDWRRTSEDVDARVISDGRHAVNLGIACGVSTAEALHDIFRTFFPGEKLPAVAELRVREVARAIQSRSAPK